MKPGYVDIDRLFVREGNRIKARKPGVWSSIADACTDCGTTERRHEARGMCKRCYIKWRRLNDPAWAQAQRDRSKRNRFKFAEKQDAYFRELYQNPEWREKRRRYNTDLARRTRNKWRVGQTVWVDYGLAWVRGTIIERPSFHIAVVQLTKNTIRICVRKLRAQDPNSELARAA